MSRTAANANEASRRVINSSRSNLHRLWTTANVQPTARGQAPLIPPTRQGLDFNSIPLPTANEWHLIPHLYEDRIDRRCFLYNLDRNTIGLLVAYFDKIELYAGHVDSASERMVSYSYRIEEEAILAPREIRQDPLAALLSSTSRLRTRLEDTRNLAAPQNPFSHISRRGPGGQEVFEPSPVVPFDLRRPRNIEQLLPPRVAVRTEDSDSADEGDPRVMRI